MSAANASVADLSSMPLDLVIEYNTEGEYEDAALALARRLFARFDEAIDSLALVPVEDEDLALYLNGRLVGSQRQSGQAPRVADVVALLNEGQDESGGTR